jgi:hypothetical protein
MSVGTLKKILEDIPDDCEITVCDVGRTGYVDECELEIIKYANFKTDVYLNISAESGSY